MPALIRLRVLSRRTRPVIIVSRDAINATSQIVLAVPCTTYRQQRRIYPSQI
jgi:mRNA interferase MazF